VPTPEADVPTYQYACTNCGHQLEAVQSFTDEPLTDCPACEGRLRKLFSAVGVVFKGSGFYRTDSRSGAKSTAGSSNGSSSGSSDSSGGSGSTSSESSKTPAAKPAESSKPAAPAPTS
jgi:putative FmdB family regulatory protein